MTAIVLLYAFIALAVPIVSDNYLNVYNNDNYQDKYCFFYYVRDKYRYLFGADDDVYIPHYQIIPYCFRSSNEINSIANFGVHDESYSGVPFSELKKTKYYWAHVTFMVW